MSLVDSAVKRYFRVMLRMSGRSHGGSSVIENLRIVTMTIVERL
jgi:hypothetical protein